MKTFFQGTAACVLIGLFSASASAQEPSTPPASTADKEAAYLVVLENRTADILKQLALQDEAKAARVHDIITNQYQSLRARDAAIDAKLQSMTNMAAGSKPDRAEMARAQSKTLHDQFLSKLAAELTPQQVETVKDRMTYGKVKFTYDGYCAIVPGLTDADKAKITELLKLAREEAIDGGSAKEKSDIFQKYKDQINAYLDAHGHDVAKAYRDWDAKQEMAKREKDAAAPKAPAPAQ